MSEAETEKRNTGVGGTTGSESGPTTGAGGTTGNDDIGEKSGDSRVEDEETGGREPR